MLGPRMKGVSELVGMEDNCVGSLRSWSGEKRWVMMKVVMTLCVVFVEVLSLWMIWRC